MSIILTLIEERNSKLLTFDAKKEERAEILRRLEEIDREINSFDKGKLVAEIDELTDCAVKLGLIKVEDEENLETQL